MSSEKLTGSARRRDAKEREHKSRRKTTRIVAGILAAYAVLLALALTINSGVPAGATAAVISQENGRIDGAKISANEYKFFWQRAYSGYADQEEYMAYLYAQFGSSYTAYLPTSGVALDRQYYGPKTDDNGDTVLDANGDEVLITWQEFFDARTSALIVQVYAAKADADAEGYTLSEDSRIAVANNIAQEKSDLAEQYASSKNANLKSLKAYLRALYTKKMTEAKYTELLELLQLVSDYSEYKNAGFVYDESASLAYYDEHKDELDVFTYYYFNIKSFGTLSDEPTDEELAAADGEVRALADELLTAILGGTELPELPELPEEPAEAGDETAAPEDDGGIDGDADTETPAADDDADDDAETPVADTVPDGDTEAPVADTDDTGEPDGDTPDDGADEPSEPDDDGEADSTDEPKYDYAALFDGTPFASLGAAAQTERVKAAAYYYDTYYDVTFSESDSISSLANLKDYNEPLYSFLVAAKSGDVPAVLPASEDEYPASYDLALFIARDGNDYKNVSFRYAKFVPVVPAESDFLNEDGTPDAEAYEAAVAVAPANALAIADRFYYEWDKSDEWLANLTQQYSENIPNTEDPYQTDATVSGSATERFTKTDKSYGDEVTAWLWDSARVDGDEKLFKLEDGTSYVVRFTGYSEQTYRVYLAEEKLRAADFEAWQTAITENATVKTKWGVRFAGI
ncbi:MAG: hypothetical protein LBS90_06700 [Oscillospiraceae bacterium]|jgi:hypothetical protein|nr:hypothetical protein [Oscillospiraceae bacterium]